MHYPISERVGALIIRKNPTGLYELLLFEHPDCEEAPIQIPGGGIEAGESMEAALHREIYEESSLTNLTILRKLGIAERCWLDTKITTRRHCFLLEVSYSTPDHWEHIVDSHDFDAGFCFSYFWHRPTSDTPLLEEWQMFMNSLDIPELYTSTSASKIISSCIDTVKTQ